MSFLAVQGLSKREKTLKAICSELNNFLELKPTLISIIDRIKKLTNVEAISIRLHEEGDYPYYVYDGFPESFILKENSLCSRDEFGERILDENGEYILDCMCGNIMRRTFDPSQDFFTENGSFWSNNTSKMLSSSTEEDRQGRTRNYCNSCGYESVALIPINHREETIGLIQLNDSRTNMYTLDLIEYLEMIGEQAGIAIMNSMMYTKLSETLNEIKLLKSVFHICFRCRKVRNDKGNWQVLEDYMRDTVQIGFSHGLCPNCQQE